MKKKLISLLCAMAMVATIPAGYGVNAKAAEASDLEYVEMDWYITNAPQPDCEMVTEALNEYLLEKLNMKVNLQFLGGDYSSKVSTMLQAGEDCGIVTFLDGQCNYSTFAEQGAFYALEDLLEQYGTGTKAMFSDDVWESMKIDGKIYGVPTKRDNCDLIGYAYNKNLAEELGIDMSDDNGWRNLRDGLDEFLAAKAKRDELYPEWEDMPLIPVFNCWPYFFNTERLSYSYLCANVPGMEEIEGYDCDTLFNLYATDEFKEFCLKQQELMAAGVYPYDSTEYPFIAAENSTLATGAWGLTYLDEYSYNAECPYELVIYDNVWADSSSYNIVGLAISANCANPERAMMLMELLNTDSYLATLLRFGIEGEHYEIDENGAMVLANRNSDPSNLGYLVWYGVCFGNVTITNTPEAYGGPDGIAMKRLEEYVNTALLSNFVGFVPDFSPVSNEVAACSNVISEYADDLESGRLESQEMVLERLDEFNQKLVENGVEKVMAEIQSQYDAWKAAK